MRGNEDEKEGQTLQVECQEPGDKIQQWRAVSRIPPRHAVQECQQSKFIVIQHTKRSQPICFKSDLSGLEEKPRKSLNKIKGSKQARMMFGGNENECPDAMFIEDL